MGRLTRRVLTWGLRRGTRSAVDTATRSAVEAALGTAVDVVPKVSRQVFTQIFNVDPATTVYIRASHCRIQVQREDVARITLRASALPTVGPELVTEQDEAGVYIVAKSKPVVGKLTPAHLDITVPRDSHLVFHLTPGDILLQGIDGLIEFPPETDRESGVSP